jgi:Polysaccharide lyase family 4, domain II
MRGRHTSWLCVCVFLFALAGCGPTAEPDRDDTISESTPALGSRFDKTAARTISGQVVWNGPVPSVEPFDVLPNPLGSQVFRQRQLRANPNAPVIDPACQGVAGAIVFLSGVDPTRSRPWDLPSVRVEQRDCQIEVDQGDETVRVGIVRQNDPIEMVSRDPWLHALHADGTSFFTLMFPDPDRPLVRRLPNPGLVELTSAAGFFWMRGYLFVAQHPYHARTDRSGRFTLSDVPPGSYQLTAWLPNWRVARQERDPESSLVKRVYFEPALERTIQVEVKDTNLVELNIAISPGTR